MPAKLLHVDHFEHYDYDSTVDNDDNVINMININRSKTGFVSDEQDDEVPPGETALVEFENCSLARVQWPGQRPENIHVNFEQIYDLDKNCFCQCFMSKVTLNLGWVLVGRWRVNLLSFVLVDGTIRSLGGWYTYLTNR